MSGLARRSHALRSSFFRPPAVKRSRAFFSRSLLFLIFPLPCQRLSDFHGTLGIFSSLFHSSPVLRGGDVMRANKPLLLQATFFTPLVRGLIVFQLWNQDLKPLFPILATVFFSHSKGSPVCSLFPSPSTLGRGGFLRLPSSVWTLSSLWSGPSWNLPCHTSSGLLLSPRCFGLPPCFFFPSCVRKALLFSSFSRLEV